MYILTVRFKSCRGVERRRPQGQLLLFERSFGGDGERLRQGNRRQGLATREGRPHGIRVFFDGYHALSTSKITVRVMRLQPVVIVVVSRGEAALQSLLGHRRGAAVGAHGAVVVPLDGVVRRQVDGGRETHCSAAHERVVLVRCGYGLLKRGARHRRSAAVRGHLLRRLVLRQHPRTMV